MLKVKRGIPKPVPPVPSPLLGVVSIIIKSMQMGIARTCLLEANLLASDRNHQNTLIPNHVTMLTHLQVLSLVTCTISWETASGKVR